MRSSASIVCILALIGWAVSAADAGQGLYAPTFSIDWQSTSAVSGGGMVVDSWYAAPMNPDDILSPALGGPPLGWPGPGPMPPPGVAFGSAPGPWGPGLGPIAPGRDGRPVLRA